MVINNVEFSADLQEILNELVAQLRANDIPYIQRMIPTTTDIQITCPYHKEGMERRPSAGIRKSDGLFHCFVCQETHSLQDMISHCFGRDTDKSFGWNWLITNFASVKVENRRPIQLNYTRNSIRQEPPKQTFVSEEELDSYRYIHPYMYKRKLTDEIIERFDIGYDKDTDCITFPNRDIHGNCLFVARRSVQTKYFNYPSGVEKPVYGLYEYIQKVNTDTMLKELNRDTTLGHTLPQIVICESMLDTLACWVFGSYSVALNGLGTEQQFEILRNFPCRKYVIATDMDERGLAARPRIKKALYNKIVTEYFWDKEIAKDINDMDKAYFQALPEYF